METTFSSAMLAITSTVTARVFTFLGLGFISYSGIKVLASKLEADLFSAYAGINPVILDVLNLAGLGESLHIITAAFITKAGLMAVKRIGVLPSAGSGGSGGSGGDTSVV